MVLPLFKEVPTPKDWITPPPRGLLMSETPVLPQPPGVNDKPRDIAEDDDSEGSTGHHAKLVAPEVSPEKDIARLEDERLVEVERCLLRKPSGTSAWHS